MTERIYRVAILGCRAARCADAASTAIPRRRVASRKRLAARRPALRLPRFHGGTTA